MNTIQSELNSLFKTVELPAKYDCDERTINSVNVSKALHHGLCKLNELTWGTYTLKRYYMNMVIDEFEFPSEGTEVPDIDIEMVSMSWSSFDMLKNHEDTDPIYTYGDKVILMSVSEFSRMATKVQDKFKFFFLNRPAKIKLNKCLDVVVSI